MRCRCDRPPERSTPAPGGRAGRILGLAVDPGRRGVSAASTIRLWSSLCPDGAADKTLNPVQPFSRPCSPTTSPRNSSTTGTSGCDRVGCSCGWPAAATASAGQPRQKGGGHAHRLLCRLRHGLLHPVGPVHRGPDPPWRVAPQRDPSTASLRGRVAPLAARADEPAVAGRSGQHRAVADLLAIVAAGGVLALVLVRGPAPTGLGVAAYGAAVVLYLLIA